MKPFFAFVHKEFLHILRDSRTMLLLLGLPVAQVLLFGFAINMEVSHVRLAVCHDLPDATVKQITEHLIHNPSFDFVAMAETPKQIEQLMREGQIDVAVVFPAHFESELMRGNPASIQVVADASNPNMATIITGYIEGIIGNYFLDLNGETAHMPFAIDVQSKMMYNPQLKSTYNFVPGVMGLVLLLICSIMTSVSIIREKERGTMEVLLVSPVKTLPMIIAKTIPYLAVSLLDLLLILLLSYFVLHVPINGSLGLLIAISVLYIFLSLSLGLLISVKVNTQIAAIIISGIGLMMPSLVLSGMIFPIANMPDFLQWISCVVPTRWYIDAVRKVMIQGVGFLYVWKEMTILFAMIMALLLASIFSLKKRLE